MIIVTVTVSFVLVVLLWACLISASKADDAAENYLNS